MEIVVLIKPVPEADARLRPDASGSDLEAEGVKFVLAGYDESAVEQALLLQEAAPGTTVRAMSLGPSRTVRGGPSSGARAGRGSRDLCRRVAADRHDPDAQRASACRRPDSKSLPRSSSPESNRSTRAPGTLPSALAEVLGVADFSSVTDLHWDASARRSVPADPRGQSSVRPRPAPGRDRAPAGLERPEDREASDDPEVATGSDRPHPSERGPIGGLERGPRSVRATAFRLPPPRTGAG